MKFPLIKNIKYNNPISAFLVNAIVLSIILALGFSFNEYLDDRFQKYELKHRVTFKVIFHFISSFVSTFVILSVLYILFGIGSHYFPLCSYVENCKHSLKMLIRNVTSE